MAASRRFGGPGPSVTIILGMLSAPASAAPDLEGCYVGALPCGTPARMSGLVAQCLAKPALCGTLGGSPLAAAGSAAIAPPARIATAPRNTGRGIGGGPPASPPPTPEVVAARAVETLAEALPIAPQLRNLVDRIPADTASVERALGLRRSSGPVTDLGDGAPSVADLLAALAPAGRN